MNPAILISNSGRISAVVSGKSYTVETDHVNYSKIIEAIRASAWEQFVALCDVASSVRKFIGVGSVQLVDGAVTYKGEVMDNSITNRILDLMNANLPFEPMVKFLANLMQNPSKRAVDELYGFLEHGNLPITEDGHFLAFKNVRADYFDIHSGTKRNQVGDKPAMDRNMVDEDKSRTCSQGLHFCSEEYLPHFRHSDGGHTMIVKINPRDVVAIPADYNNTKGRTCTYEVVAEMQGTPSDYTSRKVIGEFDPKLKETLENSGNLSESEVEYYTGFDAGFADASNGHYVGNPQDSAVYVLGYDAGQDAYDLQNAEDDDSDDCKCDCGMCNGDLGVKPDGKGYHNVRDAAGRFVRKDCVC